jgi:hypothetical protein
MDSNGDHFNSIATFSIVPVHVHGALQTIAKRQDYLFCGVTSNVIFSIFPVKAKSPLPL